MRSSRWANAAWSPAPIPFQRTFAPSCLAMSVLSLSCPMKTSIWWWRSTLAISLATVHCMITTKPFLTPPSCSIWITTSRRQGSAAAAELLTIFLLHVGQPIPRLAADCLLAGIITDTRAFEFDATTDRTLLAGAYLVACGAIPEAIIKPMYRLKPLAKARLWGRALSAVRDTAGGRIVWAQISQTDLAAAGATSDMDDGLSTYLVDIPGVAYAALLRESLDGSTRVSLRTTAPYDAAAVCAQFDGGGHVRAAGCTLHMGLEEASQTLVAALEAALEAALISTGRSAQSPHPA